MESKIYDDGLNATCHVLNFRATRELKRRADDAAKQRGVNLSTFLRQAVEAEIRRSAVDDAAVLAMIA